MRTTTLSCGAPIPGTQNLCTRGEGHEGEHRCTAADVDAHRAGLVLRSNYTTDPITRQEVLPCPFCGGAASVEEVGAAVQGAAFTVGCDSDADGACYGYQSLTTFSRRSDAIAGWNRRAGAAP